MSMFFLGAPPTDGPDASDPDGGGDEPPICGAK